MIEVYMDNYISLSMVRSRTQSCHISTGLMIEIYYVLYPYAKDKDDPISLNKIPKKEGVWSVVKDVLGFNFDGNPGEYTT